MRTSYIVAVPAYNEGRTIANCIKSISSAAAYCCRDFELKAIVVCTNGCTDNTEYVLIKLREEHRKLILLDKRSRGYIPALNKIISYAKISYPRSWVIKIDADSRVEEKSFSILLNQLRDDGQLLIVGGHAIPDISQSSCKSGILSTILSIRALFPMAEISKRQVAKYHGSKEKYSEKIDPLWVQKSKIYFHGRFWAAKDVTLLKIPNSQIGDDVYLTAYLYTTFGLNTIRVRYDANCLFFPIYTLRHHWKIYRRIHEDIKRIRRNKKLSWYANESQTKLNWPYIIRLEPKYILMFFIYSLIVALEKISFRIIPYNENTWQYETKIYEK